jgi:hypothetical protein
MENNFIAALLDFWPGMQKSKESAKRMVNNVLVLWHSGPLKPLLKQSIEPHAIATLLFSASLVKSVVILFT